MVLDEVFLQYMSTTQNPIFVQLLRVTPMYLKQLWYSQDFTILISLRILQEKTIDIGISVHSLISALTYGSLCALYLWQVSNLL